MFQSARTLIQTPKGPNTGDAELEFTPIGQENSYGSPSKRVLNFNQGTVREKRNPLNNSPITNRIHGGSSFIADSSFDTIHHSMSKQPRTQASSSSPIKNNFQTHDLLNNGSNPVKQQQENVSRLQEDNYNLKVKIASLTRFLDSITNNKQQEIYKQNSELQEKLIKTRSEVSLLNKEITDLKSHEPRPSESEIEKFKNEISRLTELKNELEQELEEKKDQLKNRSSPISKSYIQRINKQVEDLQGEIEEKDYEIRRKNEILDAKEDEIESLGSKVEELQREQRSQIDRTGNIDSQVDKLKTLLKASDEKSQQYEETLKTKNNQLKTLKINSEKILKKLESYDQLIKDLKISLKQSTRQNDLFQDKLRDMSNSESSREKEILIKSKRHQLELESEIQNLQSRIGILNNTISQQQEKIDAFANRDPVISNDELAKLLDKLETNQKKVADVVSERDSIKKRLESADMRYIELKNNSEKTYRAYERLKIEIDAKKTTDYDDYDIKDEIEVLSKQVNDLNFHNKTLESQIQRERDQRYSAQDSYHKQELKSLMSKCNALESEIFEKDKLVQRANTKYQKEIQDFKRLASQKDEQIISLKKEIKSFELLSNEKFEDEKFELLKSKSSKDKEIKLLKFQLDQIKEEYQAEIQYLRNTIDQLKKNGANLATNFQIEQSNELLQKIEEKNKKIKLLSEKLHDSMFDLKTYENTVSKLDKTKNDLKSENAHLKRRLHSLDQDLAYFVKELKKSSEGNKEDEINILKLKLVSKEKEIDSYNRGFSEMKKDLQGKYNDAVNDRVILQRKLEKLVNKYSQLQSSLQNSGYNHDSTKDKLTSLKDELDYYRMKYTKGIYAIKDLKFMNSFMMKSIQANNNHIKGDIKKLQQSGIYPDYELICTKKPSFSVLVKFVVAAVRIKRKTENTYVRNQKIEALKDKLVL